MSQNAQRLLALVLVFAISFAVLASPAAAQERKLAVYTTFGYPIGGGGWPLPNPPPTHAMLDFLYGYFGPPPRLALGVALVPLGSVNTTFTYDASNTPSFDAFTTRLTDGVNEFLTLFWDLGYSDGTSAHVENYSGTFESVFLFGKYPHLDPTATDLAGSRITKIVLIIHSIEILNHPFYGNQLWINFDYEFWGIPPANVTIADLITIVSALEADPAAGQMMGDNAATNESRRDIILNTLNRIEALVNSCSVIPAVNEAEMLLRFVDGVRPLADWLNIASPVGARIQDKLERLLTQLPAVQCEGGAPPV